MAKKNSKASKTASIFQAVAMTTVDNTMSFITSLPKNEMDEQAFDSYMLNNFYFNGKFHGANFKGRGNYSQYPRQMGLYHICNGKYIPRFHSNLSNKEVDAYIKYWLKLYYLPNPTSSVKLVPGTKFDKPIYFLKSLIEFIEKNPKIKNIYDIVDILLCQKITRNDKGNLSNILNQFSDCILVDSSGNVSLTYNYKSVMEQIEDLRNDANRFFEHFGSRKMSSVNQNDKCLQQIFYGAPGTGKSHATNEVVENYGGTIRTTFHPDSDYSTFVGAYKPVEEECASDGIPTKKNSITYKFVKQAFTKAYLLAWKKWMDGTNSVYTTNMLTTRVPHATNKITNNTAPFDETVIQLTQNERNAVLDIDSFGYDFSGQTSLGDIHKTIKVVITDKPSEEQLAQFQSRITKEEYDEIKNKHEELKRRVLLSQGENIGSQIDALSNLLQRYRQGESGDYFADFDCLLGLYSPAEKAVYLFMDNIRNGGKENIELLCAVYVHEMLHAYFHSDVHYVKEIEEAIVECLTLCFLKEYDDANGTNLCNEYLKHVEKKKYTPFCYYAFGKYLYENCNVDWLTEYKNKYSQIKPGSPLLKSYLNLVKLYYPFDNEQNTYNSLCRIFINNIKNNIGDSNAQFLVIEEINRGNCAQIFGDIFQLLDRQDNGFSKYPIEADTDLQKAIQKAFAEEKDFMLSQDIAVDDILPNYKSAHQGTLSSDIQNGYILLLPNNLHIWATMNTSDQSLFPMDSAFKRRWTWKYVNIAEPEKDDDKMFIELKDKDGETVQKPWNDVIKTINTYIKRKLKSSDKQIGYWFVKSDCEVEVSDKTGNKEERKGISIEQFRDKVLFFLFDDAFKDDEDFASLFGSTDYLFVDLFDEGNLKEKVSEVLDKMEE